MPRPSINRLNAMKRELRYSLLNHPTPMARLGIPVRVTEAVLNHVSGTGGGIVAVYLPTSDATERPVFVRLLQQLAVDPWCASVACPRS